MHRIALRIIFAEFYFLFRVQA